MLIVCCTTAVMRRLAVLRSTAELLTFLLLRTAQRIGTNEVLSGWGCHRHATLKAGKCRRRASCQKSDCCRNGSRSETGSIILKAYGRIIPLCEQRSVFVDPLHDDALRPDGQSERPSALKSRVFAFACVFLVAKCA